MSDLPPPGWHPVPADPAMLRWWDGRQWTEHRHPVVPPAAGWGGPGAGWNAPPGGPPAGSQPGWGAPQPGWGASQPGWGGGQPPYRRRRGYGAGIGPNSHSWTAIGFAAAYLAIALATGFVLLGIVPALAASRAWQRREKLAPVAVAAAVLTVASAIFILVHRAR